MSTTENIANRLKAPQSQATNKNRGVINSAAPNKRRLKRNTFAPMALLVTLGFIVAGFVWLHIASGRHPSDAGYAANAANTDLRKNVSELQAQVTQQQDAILELQNKVNSLQQRRSQGEEVK